MKIRLLGGMASAVLVLAISAWAASAPPPMGHPHMMVAPGARRLHAELERVSQAAARKGMYTCCIAPPCEFCAVHMAMCPCGKNVAAGKAVCRECKGGWDVGEGRVQGVNAADVKGMSAAQMMQMMKGAHAASANAGHRAH
jgi:hypothetical protein